MAGLWHGAAGLAAPGLRAMLRRRAAWGKEIPERLPEREGRDSTPRPPGTLLWLHAASVGESVSILPVLEVLARQDPPPAVLVTTGTVTSASLLAQRLPGTGLPWVQHRFVPLDVPDWAARFLDHWHPDAAAFVESELWPNLIAACRARGVKLMLVNARMSARSARGWRWAPGLARGMLAAFDLVHPQTAADAGRLRHLGARLLDQPGNLKLAAPPLPAPADSLAHLRRVLDGRPVWLAASTHPGEEAVAFQVHRALALAHPGLVTMVAPRHPGRGGAVAAEGGSAPRRSLGQDPVPGEPWVADTLGELGLLFRLAPLVFMGRSLVGQGGQNPLEPARLGCAIATGPHTANFTEQVDRLREAGALTVVADGVGLAQWVDAMLRDPGRRAAAGRAAEAVASGEAGLPERIARALLALARAA